MCHVTTRDQKRIQQEKDKNLNQIEIKGKLVAKKKTNAKKPKTINGLKSEESEIYFSTSEDEFNDIETTHKGNCGENYEENLEENFKDDFEENFKKNFEQNFEENFWDSLEENFGKNFEENHEENLEKEFEELYSGENLKVNRRSQIHSEENDNDHNDYNRPPPEPPLINSQTDKIITRKNIVECRDKLYMRIIFNYAYFVTTNGTPRENGSKTFKKRGTSPKFKNLQEGIVK